MSLATPTTQEVADNIVAQVESKISQTIPLLPKAFTRVLAKALAGVFITIYKYASFMLLQMFVAHATMRETEVNGKKIRPLVEWGRLVGVGDPSPATRAELDVTVTVTNQTGSLPAGSQLLFAASGVVYTTLYSVALDAATITVKARASSDQDGNGGVGTIGNLEAGDKLAFANPLPNVATEAVVSAVVVTGADGETEADYRARTLDRFQAPPQGGAYADYRLWAKTVTGILEAYPYTGAPGEVDVYVEATVASSGSADGIPTAAQLTAVYDAIQLNEAGLASRRPVNAAVNTLAITRSGFDVEIRGLIATDLPVAKAAVAAAADEFLRTREPFIEGLSVLPRRDRITQAAVASAIESAASAVGASVTSVELSLGSVAYASYTLAQGQKAKLGTTTYV